MKLVFYMSLKFTLTWGWHGKAGPSKNYLKKDKLEIYSEGKLFSLFLFILDPCNQSLFCEIAIF